MEITNIAIMIVNSVREIKSIRPLAPLLLTIKGRGEGRRNERPFRVSVRKEWWKVIKHFNNSESREPWLQHGFVEALIKPSFTAVPASSGETGRKTTGWARLGAQPQISKLQRGRIVTDWWFCFLLNALKAGPRRLFAIQACHHIQAGSKCVRVCEHVGYAKI